MRLDGYRFNYKCVHRVCCEMKLKMTRRIKKRVMTRPLQPLDHVEELNLVCSLDFMRNTLYDRRSFRILNVIDEGDRKGLCIKIGRSITAARVLRTMNELVVVNVLPSTIRLDNEPSSPRIRSQNGLRKTVQSYDLFSRENLIKTH